MNANNHKHEWKTFAQETTASAPTTQKCECGQVRYLVERDTGTSDERWIYQTPVRYKDATA